MNTNFRASVAAKATATAAAPMCVLYTLDLNCIYCESGMCSLHYRGKKGGGGRMKRKGREGKREKGKERRGGRDEVKEGEREEKSGEWMEGNASPASVQHVGHERHGVHTPDNVHHIDHHSGEGGGQCFRDNGARGRHVNTSI